MIDNATRAAYDAIFRDQGRLQTISHAAEQLANKLHRAAPVVPELRALAGDAWAHRENGLDIMEAATLDRELAADEVRAWLDTAAQIIERARVTLP